MREDRIIRHKFRNLFHTALLLAGMILLLAILGLLLAGVSGLVWASVLGLIFLLFSQQVSPQLVLRMYKARPLSPAEASGLYQLLQALARRANLVHVPQLYYIPSQMMNAFALGNRNASAVAITDGLLRRLTLRELAGVLAHEISHVGHNDMQVMRVADTASRMTSLFSSFGQFLLFINLPLLFMGARTISWLAILLLIAAPTLSGLLQLALSRTREFDADLSAVQLTGDPGGLASALQKLEYYHSNILKRILMPGHSIPAPSTLRTHPKTSERVERLSHLAGEREPWVVQEIEDGFAAPTRTAQVTRKPSWRMMGLWY